MPKAPILEKCKTGIQGLDEITGGGLPKGRPTLICGGPGCGKTLLATEFLIRGATSQNEPGVFIAFEESSDDLSKNISSLGFNLPELIAKKQIIVDFIRVEKSEIEETGEYDLEGLFIRIDYAIKKIGAKRIVLDTIEALFSGLSNQAILRSELRRLFHWLKDRGITAVITGERGEGSLTRQGLEEYVSDCVIVLDHRVQDQISTRRMRIVKYRGSAHGTNEYPFLIDHSGFSILPITSLALNSKVSDQRVSSGIPRLDTMLGGRGYYRGSSVLVSGTAGSGKTSLACHFAEAACRRGERVLYFAFEESPTQIVRNMRSIGLDIGRWIDQGLMRIVATRSSHYGLEHHLVQMHKDIQAWKPKCVIVDPISNLIGSSTTAEVGALSTRLLDYLKNAGITTLFISLTQSGAPSLESTMVSISSLCDTWILLRDVEYNGERNRALFILKSRGMAHSNQVREFVLTNKGVKLLDVSLGESGILLGSARLAHEAKERALTLETEQALERKRREAENKKKSLLAQIEALQAAYEEEEHALKTVLSQGQAALKTIASNRTAMAQHRRADRVAPANGNGATTLGNGAKR